jgi:hypothetical protein
MQDSGDVDNYASRLDWKVKDYNLCPRPITPSTTDTDAADTDSAKTLAKMSEQEHMFYLLRRIAQNDEWKVFLVLMMDKNPMITATCDEIVTKLVEMQAAIKERMGSLQKLCSLQRKVAKVVEMAVKLIKPAEVQRGIREMTREILRETTKGKRRIAGSAFIASGEGTPRRTRSASNEEIIQRLPTLQHKH